MNPFSASLFSNDMTTKNNTKTKVNPKNYIAVFGNDKFIDSVPLKTSDGFVLSPPSNPKQSLFVSGRDAFHPDVSVETNWSVIKPILEECLADKQMAAASFKGTWTNLKNANTDKLFADKGQAWQDFCDDLVLYYCARVALFKMPMPMLMCK